MATIDEQIAQAEARVARLKQKQKKADTRKKIIIGGTLMKELSESDLNVWLDKRLTRKEDRELFGLEPISKNEEIEQQQDYRNTSNPF